MFNLSELKKAVASGKKTIVVSTEARDWDFAKIVSFINGAHDITLDLSKTKITTLGKAFRQCQALKAIILPEGLVSIGRDAFEKCEALAQVTIVRGVESIGDYAFNRCKSLEQVKIPDSVTSIGEGAFYCCSTLVQVEIPSSVTSIGREAFWGCRALITFADTSGWYFDEYFTQMAGADKLANSLKAGLALYKKMPAAPPVDLASTATELDLSELKKDVASGKKTIVAPAEARYWDLPEIASCIKGSHGIELDLSKTKIKTIGKETFASCDALKAIVLPEGLRCIGYAAFSECKNLTYITIPGSVTTIRDWAFWGCEALAQVTIPSSVMSIGNKAFGWCSSLEQVTVPESVKSIGGGCPRNR